MLPVDWRYSQIVITTMIFYLRLEVLMMMDGNFGPDGTILGQTAKGNDRPYSYHRVPQPHDLGVRIPRLDRVSPGSWFTTTSVSDGRETTEMSGVSDTSAMAMLCVGGFVPHTWCPPFSPLPFVGCSVVRSVLPQRSDGMPEEREGNEGKGREILIPCGEGYMGR